MNDNVSTSVNAQDAKAAGIASLQEEQRKPSGSARRKGRPPLPRDPAGNIIREGSVKSPALGVQAPVPAIDRAIVKKALSGFLKGIDSYITRRLHRMTLKVTGDPGVADDMAEDVRMTDDERDTISETGTVCCEQYQLLSRHAPLALLAISVGAYVVRPVTAYNHLARVAAVKAKEAKNAISAQPIKAAD